MACSCNKMELMICPNRTVALSATLEGLRSATNARFGLGLCDVGFHVKLPGRDYSVYL